MTTSRSLIEAFENALKNIKSALNSGMNKNDILHSIGDEVSWALSQRNVQSEISVVATDDLQELIRIAIEGVGFAQKNDGWLIGSTTASKAVIRMLEANGRLRQLEPVSGSPVSLAKCKWEISKIFVPDGIWNIEEGMKMERAAKAVLDAAGVKYVE